MVEKRNPGRRPDRGTILPKAARGGGTLWFFLLLAVLGAVAGAVYFWGGELGQTRLARFAGVKAQEGSNHTRKHSPPAGEPETKAGAEKPKGERKILYYVDPMNPTLKSDKPGKAPCGMDLIPVYAEEEGAFEPRDAPGPVRITPQRQQLIGVRYDEVRKRPLSKIIRTVGRVTYDETRIAHIHAKVSGWIDKVYVDFTGMLVQKGRPLLSIYSPELVSTQQELLIAKKSKDSLERSPFVQNLGSNARTLYESTRQRLKLWDIPESEIREIEKRGTPSKSLTLYSPIHGFVLTRNGFAGHRVTPEMELYSLADLSTVWVQADVYEYELPMVRMGQSATMSLSYFPGKTFRGKVAYLSPGLEPSTRTLKARIEFPNPGYELKPDMYANVEIEVDLGVQLAVPREAVLDSGTEQVVFVAREGGSFEPRKVSLGPPVGEDVIVMAGLEAGERVVVSANFLIDSESRLKSALGSMGVGAHAGHGGGAPAGGNGGGKGAPVAGDPSAPGKPQAAEPGKVPEDPHAGHGGHGGPGHSHK